MTVYTINKNVCDYREQMAYGWDRQKKVDPLAESELGYLCECNTTLTNSVVSILFGERMLQSK